MSKVISTFDREMKNATFKNHFYEGYKEFLLSELIIAMMEKDKKSVRQLAQEVHLSTNVIQKLRSKQQLDIKLSNFINIAHACGYSLTMARGKEKIAL